MLKSNQETPSTKTTAGQIPGGQAAGDHGANGQTSENQTSENQLVVDSNGSSEHINADPLGPLLAHQRKAWRSGEYLWVEILLGEPARLSGLKCTQKEVLRLIDREVSLRQALAQSPTLREYQQRFPHLVRELRSEWDERELRLDEKVRVEIDRDEKDLSKKDLDFSSTLPPDAKRDSPELATEIIVNAAMEGAEQTDKASELSQREAIGRYEIRHELGRGTNGVVFEVWDPSLKRTVALKRLRSGFDSSKGQLERIQSEAEAIARIHHPNIVSIYDVGTHEGLPFFAMEICRGGTLEKRLLKGPLAPERVAKLMIGIASGVGAAHERQVIHRDLKPANILLENNDDLIPKVTDFGLAKTIDNYAMSTWTGSIMGTPAYMSPEQAFGEAKNVGFTSDIYSMGAIMYECLTGRAPLRGVTPAETLDQVRHQEPVAVKTLSPNVPRDLETITLKCLQKDPASRHQTTSELIEDLQRFLTNRPILARRANQVELAWRWCRRNPVVAGLVSCMAILAIESVASLLISNEMIRHETLAKATALADRERALDDREVAYKASRKSEETAKRNFYAVEVNLASHAFLAGEVSRAEDLLVSVVPAPCDVDFRRFEWYMLDAAIHRNLLHEIQFSEGEITCLSVSPDGKRLLVSGGNWGSGFLAIVNMEDGKILYKLSTFKGVVNGCGYSPDGKSLAVVCSVGSLSIFDAETFEVNYEAKLNYPLRSLVWSMDSQTMTVGGASGDLIIWKVADWENPVVIASAHKGPILRLRFSDDSKRLYSSSDWGGEGNVSRVWNTETIPYEKASEFPGVSISDESPDGQSLVGFSWGKLKLINATDGTISLERQVTAGALVNAEFRGRSGSLLLAVRGERLMRRIDQRNLLTIDEFPVKQSISAIAQDSQGEIIVSGDTGGNVRVWKATRKKYRFVDTLDGITHAAFLPSSNEIIFGSDLGSLQLSTTTRRTKPFHEGKNLRAISGDGQSLVCLNRIDDSPFDNLVQVWRIGSTEPIEIVLDAPIYGDCLAISSTGRWLATHADSQPLRVYDLSFDKPKLVHSWTTFCSSFAFSPNEKLLVGVEHGGRVCRFNVEIGERLKNLSERDSLWAWRLSVAFSEDSKLVACGNESGAVQIWNAETGELLSTLIGNQGQVQSVVFFPKSERFATGGFGGVRIWDAQTGQELMTLPTDASRVKQISINATGDSLLAVTQDGKLYHWSCKQDESVPRRAK